MGKKVKRIKRNIETLSNSIECIKDSNCIFIMKHLLIILKDIVDVIDKDDYEEYICKYCHENETHSNDPDVLCSKCRETFGHTYFSEL